MDAGAAVRRRVGGGAVVPTARPRAARVGAGVAALALEAAIAVYVALLERDYAGVFAAVGVVALLLLVLGLRFSWTPAFPASLTLLGAAYATALLLRDAGVDGAAPLVGGAALLAAELAYWTAASSAVPLERALVRRAVATSAVLAFVAFALGSVLLLVGGASVDGGLSLEAIGVAAAAAALAVVARLARA